MKRIVYTLLIFACTLMFSASLQAQCDGCFYEINMADSFGDGWNGAAVTVTTASGGSFTFTLPAGSSVGTGIIPVTEGEIVTVTETAAGTFPGEVSYTISGPGGDTPVVVATGGFSGTAVNTFAAICIVPSVCPTPEECSVTVNVNMTDSFGDGWDGSTLEVTVAGTPMMGTVATSTASLAFPAICVAEGASIDIAVNYIDGTPFDGEIGWEIDVMSSGGVGSVLISGDTDLLSVSGTSSDAGTITVTCPMEDVVPTPIPGFGLFCIGKDEPLQSLSVTAPVCDNGFFCPEVDCSTAVESVATPIQIESGVMDQSFAFVIPPAPTAGNVAVCATYTLCARGDLSFVTELWTFTTAEGVELGAVGETGFPDCMTEFTCITVDGPATTEITASPDGSIGAFCINSDVSVTATFNYGPAPDPVACIRWFADECGQTVIGTGAELSIEEIEAAVATGFVTLDINTPGKTTVFAAANCGGVDSDLVPVTLFVVDCECEDGSCPYFLIMTDTGADGWDGASLDVSIAEGPSTNYKTTPQCPSLVENFCVADGATIDMTYWNGANEDEHAYRLVNSFGETVFSDGPSPAANVRNRVKVDCPDVPCAGETIDVVVRIMVSDDTQGGALDQSWQIYEGGANDDVQGAFVAGVNAGNIQFISSAPGSYVNYDVTLEKCKLYTFVGFDAENNGWTASTAPGNGVNTGLFEIVTADLNYGSEIISETSPGFGLPNQFDQNGQPNPYYGYSTVIGGTQNIGGVNTVTGDETRVEFTLGCENVCEDVDIVNPFVGDECFTLDVTLPVTPPMICYPECGHAIGCDIQVRHIVLLETVNGSVALDAPIGANGIYLELGGTPFTYNGQTEMLWDNSFFGLPGALTVGCHKFVTEYVYCDGIIQKCTADLNVVTEVNPTMTCNDNVIVSLASPDATNDTNSTGDFFLDDIGECIVRVTPDMVMEMPSSECFGVFEEYKITIIGEDGEPVVQLGANGLPLDQFGNQIPPTSTTREPAHDFVGPDQLMQTLTYVIEHKFSGNKCWGTITVEDKLDPVIACTNYEIPCTHPNALDEFYTHTDLYNTEVEMPANIAGGVAPTDWSNTFIPVNMPCAPMGEVIQGVTVTVGVNHSTTTQLAIVLHSPAALGIAPIVLGNGTVGSFNTYSFQNSPGLLSFANLPCSATESTNPSTVIIENTGGVFPGTPPANVGNTWYIQVVDFASNPQPNPGIGGSVTTASISLQCGFPFPWAIVDCSSVGDADLLSEQVVETDCNQSDWNGSVIERVWQATDKYGRTSTCLQTVSLKAPTMDQLRLTGDVAYECGEEPLNADGDVVGDLPGFSCFDITQDQHGLCDISYTYEDQVLATCGNGYKIIRTWLLVNWCSGVNTEHQQVIKVEDTTGPSFVADNVTVGTAPYECIGTTGLDDLAIEDACSGVSSVTATFTAGGGAYTGSGQLVIVDLMTGDIEGLPMGATEVVIEAKDGCLNVSQQTITITVVDDTAPVAICDDELHVSLGSDGTARLSAEDVDEGSNDNCSDVTLEVRRTSGCLSGGWGPTVNFACCDVDELVTVELRATDAAGNSNVCWKEVLVEDALAPVITCAPDKTLDCDDAAVHDPFTAPEAIDNCTATIIDEEDGGELDQCKAGILTRTWTASDGSSKSPDVRCTQRITVNHVSDFVVQFPADVTLTNCAIQDTGAPSVSDDDCELLAINSDDLILDIVDDACYKIERTWTVINWCVYDQGNASNTDLGFPQPLPRTYQDDDGYFQYTQIIKVLDAVAPVIDCPGNQDFCDLTEGCEGQADLTITATDACSPAEALEYTYKIDAFNDGSFDIVANGNDASGVYPYGTHSIKWIVEDGCGNTSTCEYEFTVRDCKNPTPVCLNGVSAPGMNSDGCVEIWASDLLEYAFDNCTNTEYVEGSVRVRRVGANSAPQSVITLCCADGLGPQLIEVWVEDEAGNADYCTTYVDLQDPNGVCDGGNGENGDDSRMIAGTIATEAVEMVEDVMVDVAGSNGMSNAMPTENNGHYGFALSTGVDYTVTPGKDTDPLNGVSTYDLVLMSQHILGVNDLTTAYQHIAADVNNDGNITTFDVVQTRQLILYVIQDFPSNTSWRFVDAGYVFPVASNPWFEAFPEAISVDNLTQDEMINNFVAVKVGDVNGDARANTLVGAEERNMTGTLVLSVEDAKLTAGNTASIDFRASDFDGINGYQFTMNFDAAAMNFTGVKAGALNVTEGNLGLSMLNEGVITTSWNGNATKVANDEVLFTLNFAITADVVLSEAVNVNSRYTTAEAYAGGDLMDVAVAFNSANGTVVAGGTFELYQNTPNPFNGETVIGFTLPTASTATLKVYDVAGKVLKVIDGDYARGYNQISLNSANLNVSGVLYYQLDTPANSATKKMIILE